jgi:hypothetical protein
MAASSPRCRYRSAVLILLPVPIPARWSSSRHQASAPLMFPCSYLGHGSRQACKFDMAQSILHNRQMRATRLFSLLVCPGIRPKYPAPRISLTAPFRPALSLLHPVARGREQKSNQRDTQEAPLGHGASPDLRGAAVGSNQRRPSPRPCPLADFLLLRGRCCMLCACVLIPVRAPARTWSEQMTRSAVRHHGSAAGFESDLA